MKLADFVINIDESKQDNRSLMMPHQKDAVDALNRWFDLTGKVTGPQNGLIVMPTGSGKTYTAVYWLLNSGVAQGYKIVWLTHRQELIAQTDSEFRRQAPSLKQYGVKRLRMISVSGSDYKMSHASRMDINICCIQSVANPYGYRFIKRMLGIDGQRKLIVVIDEAHHATSPSYRKVLTRISNLNPNRILLGLTATPMRMQESEHKRLLSMFDAGKGFIYEIKLKDLIRSGYLAKPIYQRINTNIIADVEFDLSDDDQAYFQKYGELSERLKDNIAKSSQRNQAIVKQYLDNREKYGKTLIFAVNKLHAQTLYEEFVKAQIPCEYVVSGEPGTQDTIARFKSNEFQVLINVQIMTEGSDVPDIHTLFLTRETNSDVLLMQMIGRGLRGEAAGGTKEVYIVDFHDKWEKMLFWLDPRHLDIFSALDEEDSLLEPAEKDRDEADDSDADTPEEPIHLPDLHELYMKLYQSMRAYVTMKADNARLPFGWYEVVNQEGKDDIVLVYDHQLPGYESLKKNGKYYVKNNYTPCRVSCLIFPEEDTAPSEQDIAMILDVIKNTGEMPIFYTFDARDTLDVHIIAQKLKEKNLDDEHRDYWLKSVYDKNPILQALYKTFFMFRYSVLQAAAEKKDAEIQTIDDRKDLQIIPDYYNLDELLDELIHDYPWMSRDGIESVTWSNVVVRSWFGLCKRWVIGENKVAFDIQINRLLSSPQIDREIIKYLLYHEMLHKSGYLDHDMAFREKEWAYPNSEEWDGQLDSIAYNYKLDIPPRNHRRNPDAEQEGKQRTPVQIIPEEADDKSTEPIGSVLVQEPEHITQKNTPAPGIVEGFKYCRNCGRKLPETSKFCDRCGASTIYTE